MKYLITALFISAGIAAQAQTDSAALATMTKVQLSQVYLQEVQRVTAKMGTVCFTDMAGSVPDTQYTRVRYKSVNKSITKHNEKLMKQYIDIIPYADKQEILNTTGDAWWGSASIDTAVAKVLQTGVATFTQVQVSGLQAGSELDGTYILANTIGSAAAKIALQSFTMNCVFTSDSASQVS